MCFLLLDSEYNFASAVMQLFIARDVAPSSLIPLLIDFEEVVTVWVENDEVINVMLASAISVICCWERGRRIVKSFDIMADMVYVVLVGGVMRG